MMISRNLISKYQIKDDNTLEGKQTKIDKHNDHVAELTVHLQALLTPTKRVAADNWKLFSRKTSHLEVGLSEVNETLSPSSGTTVDFSLVKQCQDQLSG